MRFLAPLALAVATLSLAACGSEGGEATQTDLDTDSTFVARAVQWREGQDPIEQVVVRIEDGQVRVDASCNGLSASGSRIEDGRLLADQVTGSEVGCSSPFQEQDEWLGELLGSKPLIFITQERLELRSEEATLIAASSPPIPR